MKKFLVVGCGGSGAKTQAYIMDQLKAILRSEDPAITSLPKAWQFVTIDVPITPEAGPHGLSNVPENGGRYVGIGSSQTYNTFDAGLSATLGRKKALGEISTWAPRNPAAIPTPMTDGAAQYRGIGRMLTLNSLRSIRDELNRSLSVLFDAETDTELNELSYKMTGRQVDLADSTPIILVISSMAGGAGASMFLDVCRILSTLPNGNPKHTAVFMYTPEIFETRPRVDVINTWPNSLAVFGEALAAQTGAATASDQAILRAAGIDQVGGDKTFARLFPIGARMGAKGTVFGDGDQDTIYRGFGRALAALMASDEASSSFVSYRLGNPASPDADRSLLGWADPAKLPWDSIPWATWGYAQLSMGRDRYAEYAAQRLSRAAFERLLRGHVDPSNSATGEEQLQLRLQDRLPAVLTRLQLDPRFDIGTPNSSDLKGWLHHEFNQSAQAAANTATDTLRSKLPAGEGMKTQEFAQLIRGHLSDRELDQNIHKQLSDAAYATVYDFADTLTDALISVSEDELAAHGVPYLEAVLARLRDIYSQRVVQPLQRLVSENRGRTPLAPPQGLEDQLSPLNGRGSVTQSGQLLDAITDLYRNQLYDFYLVKLATHLEPVLEDFTRSVISRLDDEVRSAHATLELADSTTRVRTNLADVATDEPTAWPSDDDERIDNRFKGSQNEILISEVDSFPSDYETHLLQTIQVEEPDVFNYREASKLAARAIIVGKWSTQLSEKAPENTLAPQRGAGRTGGNRAGWVSKHLLTPPSGGETRESRPGQFQARIRPQQILDRARTWIARPNDHFSNFINTDLRSYLTDSTINDLEIAARQTRLRSAFQEALSQARPLAAVDSNLVRRIHPKVGEVFQFTFSDIPFSGTAAGDILSSILTSRTNLDPSTHKDFEKVLSNGEKVRHIDVFGFYPNYSPLVFSSLLAPVAQDWAQRKGEEGFWSLRRARPLPAALPLSNAERQAMVAGWIIGTATGQIHVANMEREDASAHIFDPTAQEWVDFPSPMLTPPSAMMAPIDWMPAVIESILLAYANCQTTDARGEQAGSLHPYHLLRGLYDSNPTGPTTGVVNHPSVAFLAEFLRTGERPSQQPIGTDIASRYDYIRGALLKAHQNASTFVQDNRAVLPGSQVEDKPWAAVSDRAHASKMPYYRDLAPDVLVVTQDLLDKLELAQQQANTPVNTPTPGFSPTQPTPQSPTSPTLPDFGGGLF